MDKKTLNLFPRIIFTLGMGAPLAAAFYAGAPWYVAGAVFAGCSGTYIAGRMASDIKMDS